MSQRIQSLERGLSVLEALIEHSPIGVTELAHQLDLDKTIVYRLLSTLQFMGYVHQDENRKYTTGAKLRQIGGQVVSSLDLRTIALPFMHELAEQTKGVSHLAKMAELRAVYIEKVQHPSLAVTATGVGGEAPGYSSAAGKVLWAYLAQSDLNDLLDRTEFRAHTANTITEPYLLQQELARVREQRYALDNEEHRLGLVGIGAPVVDYTGNVVASICVATMATRTDSQTIQKSLTLVQDVAARLSAEMGYYNGHI